MDQLKQYQFANQELNTHKSVYIPLWFTICLICDWHFISFKYLHLYWTQVQFVLFLYQSIQYPFANQELNSHKSVYHKTGKFSPNMVTWSYLKTWDSNESCMRNWYLTLDLKYQDKRIMTFTKCACQISFFEVGPSYHVTAKLPSFMVNRLMTV